MGRDLAWELGCGWGTVCRWETLYINYFSDYSYSNGNSMIKSRSQWLMTGIFLMLLYATK